MKKALDDQALKKLADSAPERHKSHMKRWADTPVVRKTLATPAKAKDRDGYDATTIEVRKEHVTR